ncbi:competence protein CoiA family protein [Bacillus sp. FJAT-27251]|uniref:competence protein CoiA family protein n=1 Tax=Bacillus sp. FJAT-27251 TaxID=1684142 RepID=UPI0006A7E296|nr:competence protein CoiA family protein [Bacillus sp. FJAT-27251]
MREALHVIDNEIIGLPYKASSDEINNYKKLANKELYQCPYCKAILIVKSGDERGLYFSHKHSEACIESRQMDKAEKKYRKQIEGESVLHRTMVDIVYDELTIQSKMKSNIEVNYGYRAKPELKEYPDVWIKIDTVEYALSVVTRVNSKEDSKFSNMITNRHEYFQLQGMEPIWFIEKKEQSVEKEKNSIILWDAELTISLKTYEDRLWDSLLGNMIHDRGFFSYFNYPVAMDDLTIDVRSMYYIYSKENGIVVKVQRFLKDRIIKPYRAFLINEGYEIPFADALILQNGPKLSDPNMEEINRKEFTLKFQRLKRKYREQLRILEVKRLQEMREKEEHEKRQEEERKQAIKEDQFFLQNLLDYNQIAEDKKISYNHLKVLLKKRINLTQKEQMELWTNIMPRIKYNFNLVWNLAVENNCRTFTELRASLQDYIKN